MLSSAVQTKNYFHYFGFKFYLSSLFLTSCCCCCNTQPKFPSSVVFPPSFSLSNCAQEKKLLSCYRLHFDDKIPLLLCVRGRMKLMHFGFKWSGVNPWTQITSLRCTAAASHVVASRRSEFFSLAVSEKWLWEQNASLKLHIFMVKRFMNNKLRKSMKSYTKRFHFMTLHNFSLSF